MNDDIERRLSDAFTAKAFGTVGDQTPVPPLRLDRPAGRRRHGVARVLAPLAAAAAVAGLAIGIAVHTSSSSHRQAAGPIGSVSPLPVPSRSAGTSAATLDTTAVHVRLAMTEGEQVGVGMPVVAYFSAPITDGRDLQKATRVTVDGKPVQADWYFAPSTKAGYPVQGHLRMAQYWPAHSVIAVSAPVAGQSAGHGRTFADDLALHFSTGSKMVATVVDSRHELSLMKDDQLVGSFPVSLGSNTTPTKMGIKVVMSKGESMCLSGPGYNTCNVQYTQRLTADGEYLLAAPWNVKNIDSGIDSSNGCTNLTPAAAQKLYSMMEVGDVVQYVGKSGPTMNFGDGIDDWNVPWTTWLGGGSAPTH